MNRNVLITGLVLGLNLLSLGAAYAETTSSPAGVWTWERSGRDGQVRTSTLKLKLDDDKLSGNMQGRNGRETPIEEATYKDNQVAFRVKRTFNDREMVQMYAGKLDGDTIVGTIKFERQGQPMEREWKATRKFDPTGTWTWEFAGRNGNTWTSTLKLKLEGDKLTGVVLGREDREFPIKDASFKGNEIAFQVTRQFG
ncbi:MAG: hypothetical protein KDB23_33205, partial [Planctomycetales bacterium]|nr:hypothetical protein [Planctomycetales bacterium]